MPAGLAEPSYHFMSVDDLVFSCFSLVMYDQTSRMCQRATSMAIVYLQVSEYILG
jgi:hypothetical protein